MKYGRVIKDKGKDLLTHDALDNESIRQIQAIRKIIKAPPYEILLHKNDGYYPFCEVSMSWIVEANT